MAIPRSEAEVKTTALEKGSHQALSTMHHFRWFIPNLQDVLASVGFADIKHDVTSTDRLAEDRKEFGGIAVGAFYSILRRQAHSEVEGMPTEEEVESMRREMMEEIDGGAYARADMHQFIAWKKT